MLSSTEWTPLKCDHGTKGNAPCVEHHIMYAASDLVYLFALKLFWLIKGPDNPTSQLLPLMSNKCCSGTGKEGKTKEVVEEREVKQVVCEELCVTKLYVKDGVWQRKMVRDKVVCEREVVTKLSVKDGACESCVWKESVCDKVVCDKGLKRRAHWRAHTAQIRTFFCFEDRHCQLRRTRFLFPRWVKTIGEVPGSNASDMQRKWSTKTSTEHRATLTAKKVVYQNLSAWLARCP